MIQIKSYAKRKKDTNSNSVISSGSGYAGSNVLDTIRGAYLWGQYVDLTTDVDGDLNSSGTITAPTINSSIGNFETLNSSTLDSSFINSDTLNTSIINASDGAITTLDTSTFNTFSAFIKDLISENITTENLTVTKAAHFFKLIIDEIRASQGQILITPANAEIFGIRRFMDNNIITAIRCYFKTTDGNKTIYQNFEVDDQVVCQTFNVADNVSYDLSNKFYWARVSAVSSQPVNFTYGGETAMCHWITLDWTDIDPNTNGAPTAGDQIVQLGNRHDTTRQSAISIGAYNNPYLDSGISAPFIIQYDNIDDFNLSSHRVNIISNGLNSFKGNFISTSGDDLVELIEETQQGALTYMHMAYSTSQSGQRNFSKTYFTNATYMGFCSNHTESDAALIYSDYTWVRIKGLDGTTPESFKLDSSKSYINVKNNFADESDFYVRGYYLNNSAYQEVQNEADRIEFYDDGTTYTDNGRTPVWISPFQMGQDFENGLTSLQVKMYDFQGRSGGNVVATYNIGILRDGEEGENAIEYKLIPVSEIAAINSEDRLGVSFSYNIIKINGLTYETVQAETNGYHVRAKVNYRSSSVTPTYIDLSVNTTTPSYVNANYQTNWKDQGDNAVSSFEIQLLDAQGNIKDQRIVYAALLPQATLSITDSISTRVQGHDASINGIINSISEIEQNADSISSRVTTIENDYVVHSEIYQAADQIILQIYNELNERTGINVKDGKITLQADITEIIGRLNLYTSNGITIYDENGNPRVSIDNTSLGNLSSYYFGSDKRLQDHRTVGITSPVSQIAVQYTFDLGNFSSGQKLNIKNIFNYGNFANHISDTNFSQVTYAYTIKCGNNNIGGNSGTCSTTDNYFYYIPDYNNAYLSYTGDYTMNLTITYNLATESRFTGNFISNVYLYVVQTEPQSVKIGQDGLMISESPSHYNWITQEKTEFANNNNKLVIDSSGVIYQPADSIYPTEIGSTTKTTILYNSGTYNAKLNEGFLVIDSGVSSNLDIQLPAANTCRGKLYYVKNLSDVRVRVTEVGHSSSYKSMIPQNQRTPDEYISISNLSFMFISTGTYWCAYYCG